MTALRDFLVDWLAWAEAGGNGLSPAGHAYRKGRGLCANVCKSSLTAYWQLDKRLEEDFDDPSWPFGQDDYSMRQAHQTQHQCPKRLAWVRKTIKELSE